MQLTRAPLLVSPPTALANSFILFPGSNIKNCTVQTDNSLSSKPQAN